MNTRPRIQRGVMVRKYVGVPKDAGTDDSIFITTSGVDLEGDRIFPEGADLKAYLANPIVLWLHDAYGHTASAGIPIGTSRSLEIIPGKGIRAGGIDWLAGDEFADRVKNAWDQGKIRAASVGFIPDEAVPNTHGGYDITRWTLLEWSLVPVPANPAAVRGGLAVACKSLGADLDPELLAAKAGALPGPSRREVAHAILSGRQPVATLALDGEEDEPLRWNRALSKAFDVVAERFEPALAEYHLAARYLGVEIRNLFGTHDYVPAPRMGSFLSAVEERLVEWVVEDVRNLTDEDTEAPPVHEVIQLNSKLRRDFLVHGIRFMRSAGDGATRLVFKIAPAWHGLHVTAYARNDERETALDFIDGAWQRARVLNYLKGEAFSLSGEFIPKTSETWADLFLEEKNEKPLRRIVDLINAKGAALDNRGVLLMGPPGTGKTLSGRIMRSSAQATFIWVSARDFYRAGAFGGLAYGFDLARECSPSLLFIEDVDNWLSPYSIDLLKTEMDGIGRSSGVVTILTTNYPELLPDALIDRPGRFHDVLKLALPASAVRARMLAKWLPDVDDTDLATAVQATEGYSGAHIRELANFARVIAEEDSLAMGAALVKALEKLAEQRELINDLQTRDSRYRPSRAVTDSVAKAAALRRFAGRATAVTKPEVIDPHDDGTCPAGYEMGEDGRCHEKKKAGSTVDLPAVMREAFRELADAR